MESDAEIERASVSPDEMTALVLRIFRLNGALLAAGDRLVGALGLTSARWQLLGGLAESAEPLSVAELARRIGTTRQAVQRIANDLVADGLIVFRANPRHKRAQLIVFTDRGRNLFAEAMEFQRPWAAALGRAITPRQAEEAGETVDALIAALR